MKNRKLVIESDGTKTKLILGNKEIAGIESIEFSADAANGCALKLGVDIKGLKVTNIEPVLKIGETPIVEFKGSLESLMELVEPLINQ